MSLPIVSISMGDPAGIGPEITVMALQKAEVYRQCRPLVVGDAGVMGRAAALLGAPLQIHPVHAVGEA